MLTFNKAITFIAATTLAFSANAIELKTENDKQNFAVGYNMAETFAQFSQFVEQASLDFAVNPDLVAEGFKAAVTSDDSNMTVEEVQMQLTALAKAFQEAEQAAMNKTMALGATYLEDNAKKAGVKVTASGLQYEVIEQGNGAKPMADDTVTVHYKGTLIDGTEFDSSYQRNAPATFRLDQVIPGWTEGLQLMAEGSKYRFTLPAELGYGDRATGSIPANSVLVFEVELESVQPKG